MVVSTSKSGVPPHRIRRHRRPTFSSKSVVVMASDSDNFNPCKPIACDIQACIQRNQFQQDRCDYLVKRLYQCCASYYKKYGRESECVSCPKPDALDRKLRDMGEL